MSLRLHFVGIIVSCRGSYHDEHDYLLEMNQISKEFPGVKALDNVTFKVRREAFMH